ncbi:hypothetical protein AMK59_8065, partial [Oryctes borbonicus]
MEDQENNNVINRNNPHERKLIYRDLLNQIEDIQESNDVSIHAIKKIKAVVSEANLLNDQCDIRERLIFPEEILLDSLVLSEASDLLVKCTKAVDALVSYEPLDFAAKIADSIKTGETIEQLDFVKLLDDAREIIPNVIECSFLYGTYDFTKLREPKEKKEKVKQTQVQANKKELIAVRNIAKDGENDDSVVFLHKILQTEYTKNNNNPLKYYDFVIDTNSYPATIENMFHLSFLIRDGKAKLEIDENNIPIIRPTPRKELKSFRKDDGTNTQMITSIDMDEWNRLKSREGYVQKH